jgi:membrane protease YdiL (CAAX protease family)
VPAPEVPGREVDVRAWRPDAGPGPGAPGPAASGAGPSAGGGPPLRAAAPGQPLYLPQASWRWPQALAGLAIGAAPEALLSLVALIGGAGSSSSGAVSAGSAALLAVSALVLYSWQTLAAWLFSLRTAGRALALWGFRRPNRAILWTVPVGLVAVYAVSLAHDLVVHPEQQPIVNEFPRSGAGAALFVVVAVVMAPLFEEIVFRGFLFRGFANSWGWVWGAVASAAVFGLAHLQLDVFVPLAALGFVLAWAYKRTGSLWACIAMHGIFNAIAVLAWALTG